MKMPPILPLNSLVATSALVVISALFAGSVLVPISTMGISSALGAGMPPQINVAPGEDLTVVDSGSGPAVVLLPGLLGCAYGFRNLTPLLEAAGYRSIVVEPLGLGVSARPGEADYTLTAQADRLAVILDHLEVESACIVGHGVSATIAMRLAIRRPELVNALVSIEGLPVEHAATPLVRSKLKLAKFVTRLGGSRIVLDSMTRGLEAASGDASWVDRRTARQYFRGANRDLQGTLDVFLTMTAQEEPEELQPQLGRITCPVLLILGGAEHSNELEAEAIENFRGSVPQLEVVTVDGAGHFIFEEQPEAVATAFFAFYEQNDDGPGQAATDSSRVESEVNSEVE